ncbi:MAG: SDR family NAD(P)-dependent oxidoreductase, partial [Betaproteobacteria bacterium]
MNLGIKGKTALVTASSAGLGEFAARALAAEGVNLVMFARSAQTLQAKAQAIAQAHGVRVLPVVGDMRQAADVDRMMAQTVEAFGAPDILVLNTGRPPVPMREVLQENEEQRWQEAYETQLRGAIRVVSAVAPLMIQKGWGRIVGVTSASVKQPMLKHGLSTVFRAGLTGYLKHLANEIAATGVTVNTVCPASVGTEAMEQSYDLKLRAQQVPMRRIGRPEELGAMV